MEGAADAPFDEGASPQRRSPTWLPWTVSGHGRRTAKHWAIRTRRRSPADRLLACVSSRALTCEKCLQPEKGRRAFAHAEDARPEERSGVSGQCAAHYGLRSRPRGTKDDARALLADQLDHLLREGLPALLAMMRSRLSARTVRTRLRRRAPCSPPMRQVTVCLRRSTAVVLDLLEDGAKTPRSLIGSVSSAGRQEARPSPAPCADTDHARGSRR